MICSKLNWFFYGLSRMLHLSEFVWTLRSSVFVVFNNFLLIDATDRSKISSDQKRFFIALGLYHLSFFANTPFKDLRYAICPKKFIFFFCLNHNVVNYLQRYVRDDMVFLLYILQCCLFKVLFSGDKRKKFFFLFFKRVKITHLHNLI